MSPLEEKEILALYSDYAHVYGPYLRKDGRKVVILYHSDGKRTTRQYAKVLLEVKIGRLLVGDETVNHIDGNAANDDPSNLRVLSLAQNAADSVLRLREQSLACVWCSKPILLTGVKLWNALNSKRKGSAGPFCSRKCSGQYGSSVQNGAARKSNLVVPEYYSNKQ